MNGLVDLVRTSYPKHLRFDSSSRELYNSLKWVAKRNKTHRFIDKSEIESVLEEFVQPPFPALMQLPVVRNIFLTGTINNFRVLAFKRKSWLLSRGASMEYQKICDWLQQDSIAIKAKQSVPIHRQVTSEERVKSFKNVASKSPNVHSAPSRERFVEEISQESKSAITTKTKLSTPSPSPQIAEVSNNKWRASESETHKRSADGKSQNIINKNERFVERERFEKEILANFRVAESFHRVFRSGC